jgi:hypothetical protein
MLWGYSRRATRLVFNVLVTTNLTHGLVERPSEIPSCGTILPEANTPSQLSMKTSLTNRLWCYKVSRVCVWEENLAGILVQTK